MFLNFETMKSMLRLLPFLLPVLLTVVGCSDADNEPPLIEGLTITPSPGVGIVCGEQDSAVITLNTGDSIVISFTATDNEDLSQYKIDVHSNFDCHGHARVETSVWEVIDIVNLQGVSQEVTHVLRVPDSTTAGLYHFSIQLADFFGNSAKTEIFHISVKNLDDTVPPTLTVTEPSVDSLTVNLSDTLANDSIRFAGLVADNRALEEGGNGKLSLRYWQQGSTNVFELYSVLFILGTGPSYAFDFTVAVPAILVAGTYTFELRAFDGVNNASGTRQYQVTIE
jgi:hypothetical protein